MKHLELVLLQDVPALGSKGKIVKVKPGYGRNYLIPNKIGTPVTKESLRQIEIIKKKQELAEIAKKEDFKKLAEKMQSISCLIEAKVNSDGHLFGSITYAKIAESLGKLGFSVKESDINIDPKYEYPIKDLGFFVVQVQLYQDIVAKCKVCVTKEAEPAT